MRGDAGDGGRPVTSEPSSYVEIWRESAADEPDPELRLRLLIRDDGPPSLTSLGGLQIDLVGGYHEPHPDFGVWIPQPARHAFVSALLTLSGQTGSPRSLPQDARPVERRRVDLAWQLRVLGDLVELLGTTSGEQLADPVVIETFRRLIARMPDVSAWELIHYLLEHREGLNGRRLIDMLLSRDPAQIADVLRFAPNSKA